MPFESTQMNPQVYAALPVFGRGSNSTSACTMANHFPVLVNDYTLDSTFNWTVEPYRYRLLTELIFLSQSLEATLVEV